MYFLFDVMKGSKHLKRVVAMIFLFQKYICAGDFPFESTSSNQSPHPAGMVGDVALDSPGTLPHKSPTKALDVV